MHPFVIYIIKLVAISGIFYGYYHIALRNKRLHTFNRFFILSAIALSMVIPMLHFQIGSTTTINSPTTIKVLSVINAANESETVPQYTDTLPIEVILWTLYFTVAAVMLSLLAAKIYSLYIAKHKAQVSKTGNVDIIYCELEAAPFSFLNNLFWKNNIDKDSPAGMQIFRHEMVHIQQYHTLDKLCTKVILAFFWMNPFFWLFQKELSLVHEFLADEGSIENNDTTAFAQMLLQSHFGKSYNSIIQPFFYSPIKRRLVMLQQNNNTRFGRLRQLAVLPVAAATLLLFSFTVKEKHVNSSYNTTIVLDAGHGGTDHGGINKDGSLEERDLTLKITQMMTRLAPEYKMNILPTRTGNTYPTLNQRARAADGKHADAFISIHINKNPDHSPANLFEVCISEKNKYAAQSRLLASAIIASCKKEEITALTNNKSLWVLKENSVPAVLIECGNIDNADDMAMFKNDAELEKMCRNILAGIVLYKGVNDHDKNYKQVK